MKRKTNRSNIFKGIGNKLICLKSLKDGFERFGIGITAVHFHFNGTSPVLKDWLYKVASGSASK